AGKGETIDFVFDRQQGLEIRADSVYRLLRDMPCFAGQIGSIDFRDDKEFLPLQAADLMSWQARRFWSTPSEPKREHFDRARNLRRPPLRVRLRKHHLQELLGLIQRKPGATGLTGRLMVPDAPH